MAKKAKKVARKPATSTRIAYKDPSLEANSELIVTIEGIAPLIQCRFGESPRNSLRDRDQNEAKAKPGPRNPEKEFLEAFHIIGDRPETMADLETSRFALPAEGFKKGLTRVAKLTGEAMVDVRSYFNVIPDVYDLIELDCTIPIMREDIVRIKQAPYLRYRPMFESWGCVVRTKFNARMVSPQQLMSWWTHMGDFGGMGEWRPGGKNSSGPFGTFRVADAKLDLRGVETPKGAEVA